MAGGHRQAGQLNWVANFFRARPNSGVGRASRLVAMTGSSISPQMRHRHPLKCKEPVSSRKSSKISRTITPLHRGQSIVPLSFINVMGKRVMKKPAASYRYIDVREHSNLHAICPVINRSGIEACTTSQIRTHHGDQSKCGGNHLKFKNKSYVSKRKLDATRMKRSGTLSAGREVLSHGTTGPGHGRDSGRRPDVLTVRPDAGDYPPIRLSIARRSAIWTGRSYTTWVRCGNHGGGCGDNCGSLHRT